MSMWTELSHTAGTMFSITSYVSLAIHVWITHGAASSKLSVYDDQNWQHTPDVMLSTDIKSTIDCNDVISYKSVGSETIAIFKEKDTQQISQQCAKYYTDNVGLTDNMDECPYNNNDIWNDVSFYQDHSCASGPETMVIGKEKEPLILIMDFENGAHAISYESNPLSVITAVVISITLFQTSVSKSLIVQSFVLFTAVSSEMMCSVINKDECSSLSDGEFCCAFVDLYSVIKDIEIAIFVLQCICIGVIYIVINAIVCNVCNQKHLCVVVSIVLMGCILFTEIILSFVVVGMIDQGNTIKEFEKNSCAGESSVHVTESLSAILDSSICIGIFGMVTLMFFSFATSQYFFEKCTKKVKCDDIENYVLTSSCGSCFMLIKFIVTITAVFGHVLPAWNHFVIDPTELCYTYITASPTIAAPTLSPITLIPTLLPTTYYPTFSPTVAPTVSPTTAAPTLSPTRTLYEMIDLNGQYLCNDLVTNIYETESINGFDDCKSLCLYNYTESCAMVNYINSNSLKCYLFDEQCVITTDNNIHSLISFSVLKRACINYPFDWVDEFGNDCALYVDDTSNSSNESYPLTEPYCEDAEALENLQTDINAKASCCECTGGMIEFDEILIDFVISSSTNIDALCDFNPDDDRIYKSWDNIDLYHMCNLLNDRLHTNIDCTPVIVSDYFSSMDFIFCDFSNYEIDSTFNDSFTDLYFTFVMEQGNINTMYINTNWYNLERSSLTASNSIPTIDYLDCLSSMASTSLFISYPCNDSLDTIGSKNLCEFASSNECIFSSSDSIFCCEYMFAENSFINDSKLIADSDSASSHQKSLKIIEIVKYMVLTAVIMSSVFAFWMILLLCINCNDSSFDLARLCGWISGVSALLNLGIVIAIFYFNTLTDHFQQLSDNNCFAKDASSVLSSLDSKTNHVINVNWVIFTANILTLILCIISILIRNKEELNKAKLVINVISLLCFIVSYLMLIISYCGWILPIWNKYWDLHNDYTLCYTPSIDAEYFFNDLFSVLWIVLTVITILIICGSITFLHSIVSSRGIDEHSTSRYLTLLAVLVSALSSIGSVALTDNLGLTDTGNGTVAIFTAISALSLASIKIIISFSTREQTKQKMKSIALFMSTLTDSSFDFFQGIAAILSQKYSSSAFILLAVSTWIGVADELVECVIEIFVETCEGEVCCNLLDFMFLGWSIAEAVMGIILLLTYDALGLTLSGIIVESIIILLSIIFIIIIIRVYNIYW